MNNAALSAVIVIVCIVAPMGVAYLYPSDSSDVTDYTVAKTTDISSNLYNSEIPAYGYYSGVLNNMFQTHSDTLLAEPVNTTTNIGTYPVVDKISGEKSISTISLGKPNARLGYADFAQFVDTSVFMTDFNVNVFYKVDDRTSYIFSNVVIYPSTHQMYVYNLNEVVNVTSTTVGLVHTSDTVAIDEYQQRTYDGKPLYADMSGGILIPSLSYATWTNSFQNSKVTMVFPVSNKEFDADLVLEFRMGEKISSSSTTIFKVNVTVLSTGDIYVHGEGSSSPVGKVGSTSVYDHLLVEFEYDGKNTADVTVTGISGLSRMDGDYSGLTGNGVTVETTSGGPLRGVRMGYTGGDSAYYVSSAYVKSGTTKVMSDATVTPSDYYPDSNWTVRLGSTAIYGDTVTFYTRNGESLSAPVENGKISLAGLSEFTSISLLGMTVENRADTEGNYTTLINGVALPEQYAGLTSIEFSGDWSMNVYLSDLDATTHKEYLWTAGGFGLDTKGFALAGLATAVLAFIGVGLWGQRSGQKVIIAMLTASMCGVVYLLML